ncbi:hypothetical protein Z043_103907 [Scleropages formosus]|uniref:Protein kinase domain-containing protein n=1 Tax=Scleropages formosus TaxID=113540 RepID=A0A0P7XIY0_SCLFO|nr:hypothetical protein Z043_103907 [Scleropages formosus]
MRKLDHCNIVRLRYFFYSSGDKIPPNLFIMIGVSVRNWDESGAVQLSTSVPSAPIHESQVVIDVQAPVCIVLQTESVDRAESPLLSAGRVYYFEVVPKSGDPGTRKSAALQ